MMTSRMRCHFPAPLDLRMLRLGDARTINRDGLSHQRHSLMRRGRILRLQRQRYGVLYRSPNAVPLFAA